MKIKRCTGCKRDLPLTQFYFSASKQRYLARCLTCTKRDSRKYRKANPDKVKKAMRKWQQENREKVREINRRAYANRDPQRNRDYARETRSRLREQTLDAYGGPVCACCGEDEPLFLTLDHVDGGGRQERLLYGGGDKLMAHLRRLGFPPGYQVLCFNCNSGRARNGGVCPHKKVNRANRKTLRAS